MEKYCKIGKTPLLYLPSLSKNPEVKVYAKLESQNPTGSIKDRVVDYMLKWARQEGLLKNVTTIVEASSGGTAGALARIAQEQGFRSIIFTPSKTSLEKKGLAKLFGAQVINVSEDTPFEGHVDYMRAASAYASSKKDCYFLNQYNNTQNTEAHYHGLGAEIYDHFKEQTIQAFISVASTGGTISGVSKRLKEEHKETKIIIADSFNSIIYPSFYKKNITTDASDTVLEGVGKNCITKNLNLSLVDKVIRVQDQNAINMVFELAAKEGIFVGGSSGANAVVAQQIAAEMEGPANIVTVFADSGMKYASKFFNPEWFKENNLTPPDTCSF